MVFYVTEVIKSVTESASPDIAFSEVGARQTCLLHHANGFSAGRTWHPAPRTLLQGP